MNIIEIVKWITLETPLLSVIAPMIILYFMLSRYNSIQAD